jgi:hypothetical protein
MSGNTVIRNLLAMCILFACVNNAHAVECQPSAQASDSHWAWRLIDGRKCWYKGASGMDKSLLHWPADTDSPDRLAATLDKPKDQDALTAPEVQSMAPEILQMLPVMPPQPSFEDRWRLR